MSYNILADYYTKEDKAPKLWPNMDMALMQDFDFRATRVIREISE